jgi:long-chain fatty acid transport protein
MMTRLTALTGTGLAVLMASTGLAHAGGFIVRAHTASGFGSALAGVSAGDRLSYSFWNPAVLSNVEGFQVEGVATAIFPFISIEPDASTNAFVGFIGGTPSDEVDIGKSALVPAAFASYQLNDQLTLGIALTSPFGMNTEAPENWAGQVYSRKTDIFSLNANPMMSYRINDMISVGAGLQFEYFSAELTQAFGPEPGAPDASLEADNFVVGFNLGVQVRPWNGTVVGLGYRSSIEHDVNGDFRIPGVALPASTVLDTPDVLSLGINQTIAQGVRLLGTVEWNNWSRIGTLPVVALDGSQLTALNLEYRDGWLFALGAEYDYSSVLTLRAGIGYEIGPLTLENRDTRSPELDQLLLSAGLTYRWSDRVTLDASYLYSHGLGDGRISIEEGNPRFVGVPFNASSDLDISILSAGLTYRFGG